MKQPRLQFFLLFLICVAGAHHLQAGRIHELIADSKVKDRSIKTFLRRSNKVINEMILMDGHTLTVLEHAAKMGRWPLVLWMLDYFPSIDVNRRGFSLHYLPLLGYATMMHLHEVDEILRLRPDAAVGGPPNGIKWQHHEHPFLETAARYGNWVQFAKWLEKFPNAPVSSHFSNSGMIPAEPKFPGLKKNTILAHLIFADQRSLLGTVLLNNIPNDEATNLALLELIETLIPIHFKQAILLDLMRRDPRTFALVSDWMSYHPIVISLRKLFHDALKCSTPQEAFEFIKSNQPDLVTFGHEFILSALEAKRLQTQLSGTVDVLKSVAFGVACMVTAGQSLRHQ